MTRTVVVCGTDTGIGKTVVAAALVTLLDADYWKPIQSGLDGESDRDAVVRLSGITPTRAHAEVYRLHTPVSPHRAAELDGIVIDPATLKPPHTPNPLAIEPAGGLLVPLTRQRLQIDVIANWTAPAILVAATRLGTINHTLLSLEAMRARAIRVAGIIFTGEENADTQTTIAQYANVPVLGRLPHLEPLDSLTLREAARSHLDLAPLYRAWGSAP